MHRIKKLLDLPCLPAAPGPGPRTLGRELPSRSLPLSLQASAKSTVPRWIMLCCGSCSACSPAPATASCCCCCFLAAAARGSSASWVAGAVPWVAGLGNLKLLRPSPLPALLAGALGGGLLLLSSSMPEWRCRSARCAVFGAAGSLSVALTVSSGGCAAPTVALYRSLGQLYLRLRLQPACDSTHSRMASTSRSCTQANHATLWACAWKKGQDSCG